MPETNWLCSDAEMERLIQVGMRQIRLMRNILLNKNDRKSPKENISNLAHYPASGYAKLAIPTRVRYKLASRAIPYFPHRYAARLNSTSPPTTERKTLT